MYVCISYLDQQLIKKDTFLDKSEILDSSAARRLNEVRLVGGKNKEGVNTSEILNITEALEKAHSQGLDLVLVSNDARPPVVKIQDSKKLQYERKKKRKIEKSKQTTNTLKEVKFKLNIATNDFLTKNKSITKFLEQGHNVKISLNLRGRETKQKDRIQELQQKIIDFHANTAKSTSLAPKTSYAPPSLILESLKKQSSTKI